MDIDKHPSIYSKKNLIPSNVYDIQINDFKTYDDLWVKGTKINLITEKIRLLAINGREINIDNKKEDYYEEQIIDPLRPIELKFNYPVDIDKLSKNIFVIDENSKLNIPLIFSYGTEKK
ncbi:MAG: hypothetical protein NZ866_02455 [Patescibacteria group bacterium]|nr:hypothetical protein [Patescibacteria group bacterium]